MNYPANDLSNALTALAQRGWFSQRSKDVQNRIGAIAKIRRFEPHQTIYLAGDDPSGIYGVASGAVDLSYPRSNGDQFVMHRMGPGFWIGDLADLSRKPRLVSVHAVRPTVLVELPCAAIQDMLQGDPGLYADFYMLSYENFQHALALIGNLSIPNAERRIADRLLDGAFWPDEDGWISMSQSELAQYLAVSLPALERILRRFEETGLVEKSYGRFRVVDSAGLRKVIEEGIC